MCILPVLVLGVWGIQFTLLEKLFHGVQKTWVQDPLLGLVVWTSISYLTSLGLDFSILKNEGRSCYWFSIMAFTWGVSRIYQFLYPIRNQRSQDLWSWVLGAGFSWKSSPCLPTVVLLVLSSLLKTKDKMPERGVPLKTRWQLWLPDHHIS